MADKKETAASMASATIRFSKPSYSEDRDGNKTPNVADAAIRIPGLCNGLIEVRGFALVRSGSSVVVYMPKTGPFKGSKPAIAPARQMAPAGVETDDGTLPVPGARDAVERFESAIRDAWATANAGNADPFARELPLNV